MKLANRRGYFIHNNDTVYVEFDNTGKDMRKADWEISIEEKAEYRNKGYGYNALSLFISNLTRLTGNRFYRARVDIDNIASQKLFKKLGGYPDGISEFLLHGEDLIAFQQENLHHAEDESIKSIAEEFCVVPEEILGHVLEYRIDRIKQIEEMGEEYNG